MRIRPIPETDLARIAVLSADDQRHALALLRDFRPPYSLKPFREQVGDLVNLSFDLSPALAETPWERIEAALAHACKHPLELERNIAVARALHSFTRETGLISYSRPTSRWSVGFEHSVAYWSNFYSVLFDRATFIHFDPRKSSPLNEAARRFAFSMMHQRLRVEDPDFADAQLSIARFGEKRDGSRFVHLHSADGVELFSYDQLNEMIDFTYGLWIAELQRRERRARRTGGGGSLL